MDPFSDIRKSVMYSHSNAESVIELDPTQIMSQPEYHDYWHVLFQEDHIRAGYTYKFEVLDSNEESSGVVINVRVTKDLVRFFNKRGEPRFLIQGSTIGKGTFATVYSGLAKIKLSALDGDISYKDYGGQPKYAIKKQAHDESHPAQKAKDEASALTKLFDLRGKKPVFDHDQKHSFLIQRYISGKDLESFITQDAKQPSFTTDDRLRLSRLVLKILKVQVMNALIVHCDMRSENIRFDVSKWLAVIIDPGLSLDVEAASKTTTVVGTPIYVAPEVWEKKGLTHLSDLFGVGVMLYQLWNKDPLISESVLKNSQTAIRSMNVFINNIIIRSNQLHAAYKTVCTDLMAISAETDAKQKLLEKIHEAYAPSVQFDLSDLCKCCDELSRDIVHLAYAGLEARASRYNEERITIQHDLTLAHTTLLKLILECMTSKNPQLRLIEYGKKKIEEILFERKLASIDASLRSAVTLAHNQAIALRDLIEINNTNLISNMKTLDYDAIKSHVNSVLLNVEESKASINQFVETLEIAAVSDADHDTKEQVKNRIESLIDFYISRVTQLAQIHNKVEANSHTTNVSPLGKEIHRRTSSIIASYDKFTFTFDRMVFISGKLENELVKLAPMVEQYKQSQLTSQQSVTSNSVFATPVALGQSAATSSDTNGANKNSTSVAGQKRKYS